MRKILSVLIVLIFICAVFFVFSGFTDTYDERDPQASPIFSFGPIFTTLDFIVNIPDPNLKAALHDATGVPPANNIVSGDLKALTGNLILNNLDIADIEGIQYCSNITGLYLERNNISSLLINMAGLNSLEQLSLKSNNLTFVQAAVSSMPNLVHLTMSDNPITAVDISVAFMPNLKSLRLNDCAFASFPLEVTNPGLIYLYLADNNLGSVPTSISNITSLEVLDLSNTGISSLPSTVYNMTTLEHLLVSDNDISSLPGDIGNLTNLTWLAIAGNRLEHLPSELCGLPNINNIDASYNKLYDVPSNIGNAAAVYLRGNRIDALPSSVGSSSSLFDLDMFINRMTELPSNFDDNGYDFCNIEFNFLDVSPGSPDRSMIDNISSAAFDWERQFMPVTNLIATPTDTEITLTWDECIGGSQGGAAWTVDSYIVYLHDSGLVKLADLTPSDLTYTHVGLGASESHEYWVGVTYHLVYPARAVDTEHTGYTEIIAATTATPTETPSVSPSASAMSEDQSEAPGEMSEEEIAAAEEQANGTELDITKEPSSFPTWAIILISILGTAALGAGAFFGIRALRGRTPRPPKGGSGDRSAQL